MRPTIITLPFDKGDKLEDLIKEIREMLDNEREFKTKGEITIVIY